MLLLSKKPTQTFVTPGPFLRDDTIPFSEYLLNKGPGNVPLSTTHGYYTFIFIYFFKFGVYVCVRGGVCACESFEDRGIRCPGTWAIGGCEMPDAGTGNQTQSLWENSMHFTCRDIRTGLISVLIKFHLFNVWAIYSRPRSSWTQTLTSVSLIFLRASCHEDI